MGEQEEKKVWRRRSFSIFGPLLLIAIGVVLFLRTFGIIEGNLWDLFLKVWPLLFIVSGLDSLYRGDSYVGAVVWTGLGVILLLSNIGQLPAVPWRALLRLWPFMFVIWGLDLLIHRRNWWTAAIGILVGFGLLITIFWMISSAPVGVTATVEPFKYQIDDAEQAAIRVEPIASVLWIGAGAGQGNLAEGEIETVRDQNFSQEYAVVDGEAELLLSNDRGGGNIYWFSDMFTESDWRIKLSSMVPLEITAKTIMGESTLNLTGLQIVDVEQETILGKSVIYLPNNAANELSTSVIMGELEIFLSRDMAVQIELDSGMTSVDIPDDFSRENDTLHSPAVNSSENLLRLRVNLPIGILHIRYID